MGYANDSGSVPASAEVLNVRQISAGDPEAFRRMLGPGALDQSVRHALQLCWMLLPNESKSPAEVERVFREIVDRAIRT